MAQDVLRVLPSHRFAVQSVVSFQFLSVLVLDRGSLVPDLYFFTLRQPVTAAVKWNLKVTENADLPVSLDVSSPAFSIFKVISLNQRSFPDNRMATVCPKEYSPGEYFASVKVNFFCLSCILIVSVSLHKIYPFGKYFLGFFWFVSVHQQEHLYKISFCYVLCYYPTNVCKEKWWFCSF